MTDLYNNIRNLTINSLILFHSIKQYNTLTKLLHSSKLSYPAIQKQLKKIEKLGLIYGSKSGRYVYYEYTFKGTILYPILSEFLTKLNEDNKNENQP